MEKAKKSEQKLWCFFFQSGYELWCEQK